MQKRNVQNGSESKMNADRHSDPFQMICKTPHLVQGNRPNGDLLAVWRPAGHESLERRVGQVRLSTKLLRPGSEVTRNVFRELRFKGRKSISGSSDLDFGSLTGGLS